MCYLAKMALESLASTSEVRATMLALFVFWDGVSLYSSVWPRVQDVVQAGFQLKGNNLSAGIPVGHHICLSFCLSFLRAGIQTQIPTSTF